MVSNKKTSSNVASMKKETLVFPDTDQKRFRKLQLILLSCFSSFLTASLFCTPEGAVREGDYLPLALLFLLLVVGTSFITLRFFSCVSSTNIKKLERSGIDEDRSFSRPAKNLTVIIADVALFIYLLLCTFSCLRVVLLHTGDVRFALNGYWTFITPVLVYFFLRFFRAFFSGRLALEICLVLGACMLAESSFSAYSYAIINPRMREAYRDNPDKLLAENGMSFEKNSRERLLFEKRLLESVEPTGTYGLTNTLAGILAPILSLALVGIPWIRLLFHNRRFKGGKRLFRWTLNIFGVLAVLFAFFILLTTKSRSAFLAFGCGLGAWCVFWLLFLVRNGSQNARRGARVAIWIMILFVLAVVGSVLTGAIDREIITEAGKSFSYRLDYWNATIRMIADYPLLGIGPGEFQSLYARYILPTASEFIADPHNFIFELGALFGIPATTAFVIFILATLCSGILASFFSKTTQTSSDLVLLSHTKKYNPKEPDFRTLHAVTFLGLTLGIGVTFFCSFFQSAPIDLSFYGIALISFCFFALATLGFDLSTETTQDRQTSIFALVVAMSVLIVNLMAAGGIGYAPISTTLFVLAAIIINHASGKRSFPVSESDKDTIVINDEARARRNSVIAVLLIFLAVTTIFYATSYKPRMNAFLFELRYEANPDVEVKKIMKKETLKEIDPESVVVALRHYHAVGLAYAQNPSPDNQRRWQSARDIIERISPNSPSVRERCGELDQFQFERNNVRKEFLCSAIHFYQDAVKLSPTDVGKKEKLFSMLKVAGRHDEAKEIALQALQFDKITLHNDRKLTEEIRHEMLTLITETHD